MDEVWFLKYVFQGQFEFEVEHTWLVPSKDSPRERLTTALSGSGAITIVSKNW